MPPHLVMGPMIEVIQEASISGSNGYRMMASYLAPALNPFLEDRATYKGENAEWAITQGK